MEYMNREMVADRSFRHEGQRLQTGDRFFASPVDARYLTRHGKAHEAPPPQPRVAKQQPVETKPAEAETKPVEAETSAAQSDAAVSATAETVAPGEPAPDLSAGPSPAPQRRSRRTTSAAAKTVTRRSASRKG